MIKNSKDYMQNPYYIFGRNAVSEAIKSGKPIEKIYFSFSEQFEGADRLLILAKKSKIPFVKYDKKKFSSFEKTIFPPNVKTQGIIALLRTIEILTLSQLIESAYRLEKNPILVALDSINDPHNLGAIARSAECTGAAGLIITEHNTTPINPVAIKASAGALEHLRVAKVTNLNQALDTLKEHGFWVFGTDSNAEKNYYEKIYDCPVVLIIGSEGEGMRHSTHKHCDFLVQIPLHGKIESLNASVAAGIMLFEIRRQRLYSEDK